MLAPDSTIGILGGGQLGRMLALAAARLGFKCHVFAPSPDAAAFDAVHRVTCADYTDNAALDRFAGDVDVITYEFENVPAQTATFLSARTSVLPDPRVLAITQDRLTEKDFIAGLGIATARFIPVAPPAELTSALDAIGAPAILKTRRFGYDGKGQVRIRNATDAASAWRQIGEQPAILEALVPFEREVSIVAARSRDGKIECFDLIENEHRDHILSVTRAPARISPGLANDAIAAARRIGAALDYVGVFAVELFVAADADGERILFNEIAPRVHNSGHWTIEGAVASQFENHLRAVSGLPLGETRTLGHSAMLNLIGGDIGRWPALAAEPGAHIHLYGKAEARPGRKMGHVTRVFA